MCFKTFLKMRLYYYSKAYIFFNPHNIMQKDFLSNNESIFLNDAALDYNFIPSILLHREGQQSYIGDSIRLLEQNRNVKNARLQINSNEVLMKTDRGTFDLDLKDYVLEGTNFVKILPVNSFDIVGLKVTLED